jgi:mannose-6-phosphate isomerase
VLSAGKALSIQAHPDKQTAKRLNKDQPESYGDANHKPEMAIALTPFEAMCGFRRLEEVAFLLKKHPEFANCISQEAKLAVFLASSPQSQKTALQKMFESFMSCPKELSESNLKFLLLRLQTEQSQMHPHPHDEPAWERKCSRAILRLAQQFPGDPGAMSPLFLNYMLIAPGESFFMAANEPHAYVAGEIIECMACSDNVVRAGLTPKFKDVDNLVSMLTYTMGGPSIETGAPMLGDPRILRYTPPVPEFEVMMINIDPGDEMTLPHPGVPAVLLIVEGSGQVDHEVVRPGRTFYWPDGRLLLKVAESRRGPLKLALAHANMHIDNPTAVLRDQTGHSHLTNTECPPSPSPSAGTLPYMGLTPTRQRTPISSHYVKKEELLLGGVDTTLYLPDTD